MFVEQTLTPQSAVTPPTNMVQRGSFLTVAGQQSYDVTLSPNFISAPVVVAAEIQLQGPAGAGEMFTVAVDKSTLAVTGFTLWLSGLPIAGGDTVEWEASV